MNNINTSSLFYTNEDEQMLLEKLGLYDQCFDYNITDLDEGIGTIKMWADWHLYNVIPHNNVIYLPFFIYICQQTKKLEFVQSKFQL